MGFPFEVAKLRGFRGDIIFRGEIIRGGQFGEFPINSIS
jgi:hypothetical protein